MAQIKIVGDILSTLTLSHYSENDIKLLSSSILPGDFNLSTDHIEYFVYDIGGSLLNLDYNYSNFKLPSTSYLNPTTGSYPIIEIDPIKDLQDNNYSSGEFKVQYNFFKTELSSLYIKEISSDRTELRLASTILSNSEIEQGFNNILSGSNTLYFNNYLLNFGNNNQVLIVNQLLNPISGSGTEILVKLYDTLPGQIEEKDELWIVNEKVDPYLFDINLDKLIIPDPLPQLRGPNFDIKIKNQNNTTTQYQTYNDLIGSLTGSSYQQLLNLTTTQSVDINVDYTTFDNFVFFGSAKQRLVNFWTKVKQIEDAQSFINDNTYLIPSITGLQQQINLYSSSIDSTITGFDSYEHYLYYESGSYAWPKTNSTKPYSLQSTSSAEVQIWYNNMTSSAEDYDLNNYDNLEYAIPSFIKEDSSNQPYLTFLNAVGQYFDGIWVYLKSITDINLSNNNLDEGISKDLVQHVLQSLGINLYSKYGNSNLNQYLIGNNSGSTTFDNNFSSTGSYLNNIPRKDLLSELYKRIYHNLPFLLKTKGTAYGLQTFISTFGISSSILNVKEYGGYSKEEILQGYNNDKVRIISNNTTGSVLSPFTSIQYPPTSSRTQDEHYVDVSFSPQNQIDTYISASLPSTFSLDDYLGDPGYLYSSSYETLNTQKAHYYSAFTASYLDYAGFIRLIQYFDNSLFKMLKEYVPAKSNLSTGVTITSPILERNKMVYSNPSSTATQSVQEANYNAPSMSAQYGHFYDNLSGDKRAFYTGELSGSEIDVHHFFEANNTNYYLHPTSSLTNSDLNIFNHSDYNVLRNNVSSSRLSRTRKKIEYIYGTTSSITSSAELQDSYESLKSYQYSRYEGVKINSTTYNTWSLGDNSYGKNSVINQNVRKLGLFTQIVTSSFLPGRNNTSLKYLVDESGSLTELNQRNTHWEEVQRTFIAGQYLVVSQFDNQKYSNQRSTDGNKLIYNSGYSYWPMLYYSSSDDKLYFQYTGDSLSVLFHTLFQDGKYASGSAVITYPIISGSIYNIFDTLDSAYSDGNQYYVQGDTVNHYFPSYSVPQAGNYKFTSDFGLNIEYSVPKQSGSFTFSIVKNGSTQVTQSLGFTSSYQVNVYASSNVFYETTRPDSFQELVYGPISNSIDLYRGTTYVTTINSGSYLHIYTGSVNPCGGIYPSFVLDRDYQILYATSSTNSTVGDSPNLPGITKSSTPVNCGAGLFTAKYMANAWIWARDNGSGFNSTNLEQNLSTTLHFSASTAYDTYTTGDVVSFQFRVNSSSTSNFTASFIQTGYDGLRNSLQSNQQGANPYVTSSTEPFISGSINGDTIILSSGLTNLYGYLYLPSTGSNSLYSTYGDVDYIFTPAVGDEIIIYYAGGTQNQEFSIINTYTTGSKLYLELSPELPSLLDIPTYSNNTVDKFLLLTKQKDETNVILRFIKRDGLTSYGFIIPNNLHPDVLNNIDIITKEVKQKLLNDQITTL